MLYAATGVLFLIAFGFIASLEEKIKDQHREIDSLYEFLARQNDRLSVFQQDRDCIAKDVKAFRTAVPALEEQVKQLTEAVRVRDHQEQKVLEGMNNILNYDINQAMRAAKDVTDYAEENE